MDSFVPSATILLQFLLIVGIVVAWWGARRDLINIATTQQTPTLERIELLRGAVEQLLDELDQKVASLEERIHVVSKMQAEGPVKKPLVAGSAKVMDKSAKPEPHEPRRTAAETPAVPPASESRYDEVYALADAGFAPEDIARKTGLGSAEVQMVISLRPPSGDR